MGISIDNNDKVLVTMSGFFFAPDGKQYGAVYGTFKGIIAKHLHVGNMTILTERMVCVVKTDSVVFDSVTDCTWDAAAGCREFTRPTMIYNADVDVD